MSRQELKDSGQKRLVKRLVAGRRLFTTSRLARPRGCSRADVAVPLDRVCVRIAVRPASLRRKVTWKEAGAEGGGRSRGGQRKAVEGHGKAVKRQRKAAEAHEKAAKGSERPGNAPVARPALSAAARPEDPHLKALKARSERRDDECAAQDDERDERIELRDSWQIAGPAYGRGWERRAECRA